MENITFRGKQSCCTTCLMYTVHAFNNEVGKKINDYEKYVSNSKTYSTVDSIVHYIMSLQGIIRSRIKVLSSVGEAEPKPKTAE